MFSERLERLIEAALQDGMLTDQEKAAIIKRAQAEGEDVDEVDIYIQSLQQKRQQELSEQAQKTATEEREREKKAREAQEDSLMAHEKLRKGNACPHCGEPIPPLTRICPNCGKAINANETSGDKELIELVDEISKAIVEVKAANTLEKFNTAKANCEVLLKKAEIYYSDNRKVQMLVFDLNNEIKYAEADIKKEAVLKGAQDVANSTNKFVANAIKGTGKVLMNVAEGSGDVLKNTAEGSGELVKSLLENIGDIIKTALTNRYFWIALGIIFFGLPLVYLVMTMIMFIFI